ncbi:hypothetical protein ACTVBU_10730 [Sanguibacter sp. A246]|uniref:hypothetical protein n=1 Tax=Sanguibacter sp. A246 TaxID=3457326 RepID=UPI003FD6C12B
MPTHARRQVQHLEQYKTHVLDRLSARGHVLVEQPGDQGCLRAGLDVAHPLHGERDVEDLAPEPIANPLLGAPDAHAMSFSIVGAALRRRDV